MSAVPRGLRQFLHRYIPDLEEEMFSFLVVREPEEFLYRLMRDYPERGGKRFRPVLVLLACQACDGDVKKAMRTAVAFEMFQSFAVVHDDIEDDSEMRRGKPCLHKLHGIPLTINVGDALYAKVFEILSANREVLGADVALDLMDEMIRGACETFEGQAYDVGWIRQRYIPSEDEFMIMLRKKTGWVHGPGAVYGRGDYRGCQNGLANLYRRLRRVHGHCVPAPRRPAEPEFCRTRRWLCTWVTSGAYGKERGGDIAEGKRTLIIIDLLGKCTAAEREEVLAILHQERQRNTVAEIERVIALVEHYECDRYVEGACQQKVEESLAHLEKLPANPARDMLGEMLDFLVQRAF